MKKRKIYSLIVGLLFVGTTLVTAQDKPVSENSYSDCVELETMAAINVTSISGPRDLTAGQGGVYTANPAITPSQGRYVWGLSSNSRPPVEDIENSQTIRIGFDVSDVYVLSCYIIAADGSIGKTTTLRIRVMQAP